MKGVTVFRRIARAGVMAGAVVVLVVMLISSPPAPQIVVGYIAFGYLIWRAAPGVRADYRRLSGSMPGHRGSHARGRVGDL